MLSTSPPTFPPIRFIYSRFVSVLCVMFYVDNTFCILPHSKNYCHRNESLPLASTVTWLQVKRIGSWDIIVGLLVSKASILWTASLPTTKSRFLQFFCAHSSTCFDMSLPRGTYLSRMFLKASSVFIKWCMISIEPRTGI